MPLGVQKTEKSGQIIEDSPKPEEPNKFLKLKMPPPLAFIFLTHRGRVSSWPRSEAPSLEQSLLRAVAGAHHSPLLVLQHRMSPCLKTASGEAASSSVLTRRAPRPTAAVPALEADAG